MNPRVKDVRPSAGYRLLLTFTNGETGTYDCRPLLEIGVFSELQDESCFRQVRADSGTVIWPHEQDLCPDTLDLDSTRGVEKYRQTIGRTVPPLSAPTGWPKRRKEDENREVAHSELP